MTGSDDARSRRTASSGWDLLIHGGLVIDGTGAPARGADVAVADGRIAEIGRLDGPAQRVIDADGALVTPGFVDIHTHYDGQATWEPQLAPSSWHGVTTAVLGNCGVGFAPVRATDHARLIELMEGVEDIPGTALHEGLTWEWETFPEYLDALERTPHDIDVAAYVPHGPLRVYVMGERGAAREPATPEDAARMAALVRGALDAGAIGFSTSRTLNHRTAAGEPTPTLTAGEDELCAIAAALGEAGRGVIELISDFDDQAGEFAQFRRMAELSGRPVMISLNQRTRHPGEWREILGRIEDAAAHGLAMYAQVAVRPIGILLGLRCSLGPLMGNPAYEEIARLPFRDRLRMLCDPAVRVRILAAAQAPMVGYDQLWPLGDPPDYEPPPEASIAGVAAREGRSPAEVLYDAALADDGNGLLFWPVFNYAAGNLDDQRAMLLHDRTVIGLGDGGAHVGMICDGSAPTTLLTHWGRDRRGERMPLEWLVKAHTRDTAAAVGFADRGVLAPGMKADINVIDFERLTARRPQVVQDLPAGGRRLLQHADGYVATIVGGEVVYEHGKHTGALPGRLVRGGQGSR